jgi:hypothetical protein
MHVDCEREEEQAPFKERSLTEKLLGTAVVSIAIGYACLTRRANENDERELLLRDIDNRQI